MVHITLVETLLVNVPHGKWNNKQVAAEDEGHRERAEGCRRRRGLEALS